LYNPDSVLIVTAEIAEIITIPKIRKALLKVNFLRIETNGFSIA
jgi:hypothetical protein